MKVSLELPWPPTVNSYWRRVNNRTILSAAARQYRANALASIVEQGSPRLGAARLRVRVALTAPDRRRYDLDNRSKGLLDALAFARVFDDDEQVDELVLVRNGVEKPGGALVTLEALP